MLDYGTPILYADNPHDKPPADWWLAMTGRTRLGTVIGHLLTIPDDEYRKVSLRYMVENLIRFEDGYDTADWAKLPQEIQDVFSEGRDGSVSVVDLQENGLEYLGRLGGVWRMHDEPQHERFMEKIGFGRCFVVRNRGYNRLTMVPREQLQIAVHAMPYSAQEWVCFHRGRSLSREWSPHMFENPFRPYNEYRVVGGIGRSMQMRFGSGGEEERRTRLVRLTIGRTIKLLRKSQRPGSDYWRVCVSGFSDDGWITERLLNSLIEQGYIECVQRPPGGLMSPHMFEKENPPIIYVKGSDQFIAETVKTVRGKITNSWEV